MSPMTWEEFEALEPAAPGERIAWGDGGWAFGELRRPSGAGPHPVAVVVHGGCWRSTADLTYVRHLSDALCRRGWAAWTIEFRRVDQENAAWPAILVDVGRAIDHLRALAPEYDLDLRRVVTVGHSSGAHLALWAAARRRLPDAEEIVELRGETPLPIMGVVGLAPITDLVDFHLRGDRSCPESAVTDLLGGGAGDGPPAEPETWPQAVRARLRVVDPARLVPLGVPQLLVAAELDDTVPLDHVRGFAATARRAGDSVTLVEVLGVGHFEVVAPWDESWSRITVVAIDAFLDPLRIGAER